MSAIIRNSIYFQQQMKALLKNTSNVITIILTIIIFGYFLSFFDTALRVLVVTPALLAPPSFCIWTTITFCFIELHWWEVIVDIISLSLCAKLLEPLWGKREMLKFFAVINLGVALLSMFYYLLLYASTRNSKFLFEVQIHGLAGFIASLSVAVRQILPDHLIFRTKWGFFTNRHVPLIIALSSIILWALNIFDGTNPVMLCSGILCSWVYLRFYQKHNNGRGDSSDNFSFASFFPTFMQKFLNGAFHPIYICCLRVGVINKPETPKIQSNSSSQLMMVSVADPHDIERRRQIAMKALNDRLKHTGENIRTSVPRSFPRQNTPNAHSHSHYHHQHQQHPNEMDKSQPTHMMFTKDSVFIPPAIPLPYEPLSHVPESKDSKSPSETLIDLN